MKINYVGNMSKGHIEPELAKDAVLAYKNLHKCMYCEVLDHLFQSVTALNVAEN